MFQGKLEFCICLFLFSFTIFFKNLLALFNSFSLLCRFLSLFFLKDWLEQHADYEAIVDGANIGLYQQNFAEGGFSIPQVVQLKFGVCVLLLYIWLGSLQIIVCLTYYIYVLNIAIEQLDAVVKELYTRNGNKWPLIILHN